MGDHLVMETHMSVNVIETDVALITVDEAAKIAGIGRSHAYKFVRSGVWPSVKIGRLRRVSKSELLSWIELLVKEGSNS